MPLGTFLNDTAVIRLRGLLWLGLTDTANIQTRTATSDAGGGASEVWNTGPDVPARIDPVGGEADERVSGGRISDRSTHLITFAPRTTVTTKDRVSIDNRGVFEVTAVRARTGALSTVVEAVQIS
jgi:head-tail adaptor